MIDELIEVETAELAKEKGFDEQCYQIFLIRSYSKEELIVSSESNCNSLNESGEFSAPTQSLLQRWLREKHNIDTGLYFWNNDSYSYRITELIGIKNLMQHTDDVFIGTYEQTLELALVKALELIKS